jgi:hypothetical protein
MPVKQTSLKERTSGLSLKRWGVLLTAVVILAAGSALIQWRLNNPEITIYAWRIPSGQVFLAEDPQYPELQAYATREHIHDVVRPHKTDMGKLLALCQWASKAFPNTNPFPNYPPWNASTILDWIRKGKTGGFCAQYAFVFGQACQSLGYFPRYYDVAAPENMSGHFTVSVYVPSLQRWIIFEPTWGTYYVDARSVPLGMLDLHAYAVGVKKGSIYEMPSHQLVTRERIRLFYYFRYYLRNNFLSEPVYVARPNGGWVFEPYRLAWIDNFTNMSSDRIDAIPTSDPSDLNYQIDLTQPHREIWCERRRDFIRIFSRVPPLELVKVHIRRCALDRLITNNFINNPDYHPLTTS